MSTEPYAAKPRFGVSPNVKNNIVDEEQSFWKLTPSMHRTVLTVGFCGCNFVSLHVTFSCMFVFVLCFAESTLSSSEISSLLTQDFILAALAGVFILFGVIFQTRSCFLGIMGVLNIILAYPPSLFFCAFPLLPFCFCLEWMSLASTHTWTKNLPFPCVVMPIDVSFVVALLKLSLLRNDGCVFLKCLLNHFGVS